MIEGESIFGRDREIRTPNFGFGDQHVTVNTISLSFERPRPDSNRRT